MNASLTLTRTIGSTERGLRALLERELAPQALTFAEWTALAFTAGSLLDATELVARQVAGHIVSDEQLAMDAIECLLERDLLVRDAEGRLAHGQTGRQLFERLSAAVAEITMTLIQGLSPIDLETTERTLREIGARAQALLRARK